MTVLVFSTSPLLKLFNFDYLAGDGLPVHDRADPDRVVLVRVQLGEFGPLARRIGFQRHHFGLIVVHLDALGPAGRSGVGRVAPEHEDGRLRRRRTDFHRVDASDALDLAEHLHHDIWFCELHRGRVRLSFHLDLLSLGLDAKLLVE